MNEAAASIRSSVLSSLPDHAKARQLVDIYYKHAAWMYVMSPEAPLIPSSLPGPFYRSTLTFLGTYLANLAFKPSSRRYTPIPEAEFEETIFSRVYDQRMETDPAPMDSHRLAVLCLVLGLGALLDLEKTSLSAEAMRYYQLGRAALSLDSILESQSIPAIQALVRVHRVFYIVAFASGIP